MNILFVSQNKHTTNIICFDKDRYIEECECLARLSHGFAKEVQNIVLSECLTNYELKNSDLDNFLECRKFKNARILFVDGKKVRTYNMDVTERTAVAITPILIPLHLIKPSVPEKTAVVVIEKPTPEVDKRIVDGRDLTEEYVIREIAPNEPNKMGIIMDGAYVYRPFLPASSLHNHKTETTEQKQKQINKRKQTKHDEMER